MTIPSEPSDSKVQRRFRPRFSLRTFLVVVTIFCVWLGWHIHGTRRQREAVRVIGSYGGHCVYDYEGDFNRQSWVPGPVLELLGRDFFHSVVRVHCTLHESVERRRDILSPLTAEIARLPKVTDLFFLARYDIDDDDLRHLGRLTRLEKLGIENAAEVTDEGVAHLSRLRNLKILFLRNSAFSNHNLRGQLGDRSLEVISRLPELREVHVWGTFTDAGVSHLSRLKHLRVLTLAHWAPDHQNEITDQSLEFLLKLPAMDRLNLEQTKATPEFLGKLMDKFRKCVVNGSASDV